jgi:uncharacterized membrane protein YbaN (DUF454 family)
MKNIFKIVLIVTGTISLALGVIGIFFPLLPTTPFLLLSAACYIRSSQKLYLFLINNKYLGKYIKNYTENKAISKKSKIAALTFLWLSIGYTIIFLIPRFIGQVALVTIALAVTIHIIKLKTAAD